MSGASKNTIDSILEHDLKINCFEKKEKILKEELDRLNDELKRAYDMAFEISKQLGRIYERNSENVHFVKEKNSLKKETASLKKERQEINERIKQINKRKDELSKEINDLIDQILNLQLSKLKLKPTISSFEKSRSECSASASESISATQMSKLNGVQYDEIEDTYCLDLTDVQSYPNHENINDRFMTILEKIEPYQKLNLEKVDAIPQSKENDQTEMRIAQFEKTNLLLPNHFFINLDKSRNQDTALTVPMLNSQVTGRSDIAIVKEAAKGKTELVVIIEFKSFVNINKNESRNQGLYQLIGASSKSDSPVLYVQTDMNTFHFMRIGDPLEGNPKIPIFYFRCEYQEAIRLINKWIFFTDKASKKELGSLESFYNQIIENVDKIKCRYHQLNMQMPDIRLIGDIQFTVDRKKIEKALNQQETLLITNKSRNGRAFKIKIDKKFYAVKVAFNPEQVPTTKLEKELENEYTIYRRLSLLQKELLNPDECRWPELCYYGLLTLPGQKEHFAIVTTFIEGEGVIKERKQINSNRNEKNAKIVDKIWENVAPSIKIECEKTLKRINRLGITHHDTRPHNFIWNPDEEKAYILDFGFSRVIPFKNEFEGLCNSSTLRNS